jgi:hypothetical protein
MSVEDKSDGRTVQLKRVRLSFTDSLKEKKATVEGGKPKHNLNIINEASGPNFDVNQAKIMSAIKAAGEKKWKNPDAYKGIQEDNPKRLCFRKGERWKNKEGKVYAGYEGNYAFSAAGPSGGQKRPKLLDRHKREVAEDAILDVMYGGTYADVIVSFYGTDEGSRGIFCSVEAIRSHQEGERMGGGIYVDADDFDDLEDDDSFDNGPSTSSKSSGDDLLI